MKINAHAALIKLLCCLGVQYVSFIFEDLGSLRRNLTKEFFVFSLGWFG